MRYINKVVLELYTAKLTEKVFEGKQMEHYATATSITSPGFHLLKTKLKGNMPTEVPVEARQRITTDQIQHLMMSVRSRL